MTDEQRTKRIHYHMYETCEGIAEHAERIVRLEEENAKLRELIEDTMLSPHAYANKYGLPVDDLISASNHLADRMRELGIEVEDD